VTKAHPEEGPRERVEAFIEHRRWDVGAFVSMETLSDGYVKVQFERAAFYTPLDDRAVYRADCGYERPPLKRLRNT